MTDQPSDPGSEPTRAASRVRRLSRPAAASGARGGARRPRVRAWPGAAARGQADAARRRAEITALQQGIQYRRLFRGLLGGTVVAAAVLVLLGTVGLLVETRVRPLTSAERLRYQQEEIARRWQAWPAADVFPEEVKYLGLERLPQYARRVGIAPETGCGRAADRAVGAVLDRNGCVTMLRATYIDETATFGFAVGVAILASEEARRTAAEELSDDDRVGVLPAAFPGTVAERFGAAQRQRNAWVGAGPYLVFATGGYLDGRTRAEVPPEEIPHGELWSTARSIGNQIAYFLADPPRVPPCTQGNVC